MHAMGSEIATPGLYDHSVVNRDARPCALHTRGSDHHLTETAALMNLPRGFAFAPSYPSILLVSCETSGGARSAQLMQDNSIVGRPHRFVPLNRRYDAVTSIVVHDAIGSGTVPDVSSYPLT